ncbi:hypothetical protein HDU97_008405 [Phlyctochytrium planicorne]|nr:hypothetical protein HDU97_008405 [Phlyctochytrium planicorne]
MHLIMPTLISLLIPTALILTAAPALAAPNYANQTGIVNIIGGNSVIDTLESILASKCLSESKNTNTTMQTSTLDTILTDGLSIQIAANSLITIVPSICKVNLNLFSAVTEELNSTLTAQVEFKYDDEKSRNAAVSALSALLKMSTGKIPRTLDFSIGSSSRLHLEAETGDVDPEGCVLGKGAKKITADGRKINYLC